MTAPDLTPDLSGTPRVEVFIDPGDLDPDAVKVRLHRFSDGRAFRVRGGFDIAPGVAVLDWECPFQTDATYRFEMLAAGGAQIGFTDAATVTLDVNDVWVHDPFAPVEGVALGSFALLDGTASRNMRPTVAEHVYTEGSALARRIGSRRRGVDQMPFGFAVESVEDLDAIQRMLGGYDEQDTRLGVLCIRTPPPARIPRTFFASVSEPEERSVDVNWGGQRSDFWFTATEVQPPFAGITAPFLTYDDLDLAFPDYDDRDAFFANYSSQDRAYEYAGLAG